MGVANFYVQGTNAFPTGTMGGIKCGIAEQSVTLSGATTVLTISPAIPTGSEIMGCQLRIDTAVTISGGATWSAAYSTGSTQSICTGQALTKNTKVSTIYNPQAATPVTSGALNITFTPNAGTFSAGVIRAIIYYYYVVTMADAA